jgi:L-asparaginase / beta-aspartyl-peptidase
MPIAITVHGGAGPIRAGQEREPRREGCRRAALAGWAVLQKAGTALDAVEAAVAALEDDPLFNAGTGSTLGREGGVEMDASIMDGAGLRAGAVAVLRHMRNPVRVARRVLEDGRHVLLAGEGALAFARAVGFIECAEADLITPWQQRRWQDEHGTVGAVALDDQGRLAAATSTGGMFGKLPGRIGDSALIGCGTYANGHGAASCTGTGESIIRSVLAKTAIDLLREGRSPAGAAREAVARLEGDTGGEAGIILIDAAGRIGHAHNAPCMTLALIRPDGQMFARS